MRQSDQEGDTLPRDTIQLVPALLSTIILVIIKIKDGIKRRNLKFVMRGKAISGAPIIKGTNQFPKLRITRGVVVKKL